MGLGGALSLDQKGLNIAKIHGFCAERCLSRGRLAHGLHSEE